MNPRDDFEKARPGEDLQIPQHTTEIKGVVYTHGYLDPWKGWEALLERKRRLAKESPSQR